MELLREIAVEYYGVDKPAEIQRLEAVLEEDTVEADQGTAFHTIFENALSNPSMKKSEIFNAIQLHPNIKDTTKSDDFIFNSFCRLIKDNRACIKTYDWFAVERRVKVKGLPQFGTCDLVGAIGRVLKIKDLKCGYVPVDAKENYQFMTYGTGILDEVDMDGVSGWDKYDTVEFDVIGLRFSSEPWSCSVDDMRKFKQEVMYPAFINTYAINPVATPGGHCKYCAGKIHCGAWQDKYSSIVNETYSDQDIRDLGNPELVEMWKLCKSAEMLIKQQLGPELLQRFDSFDEPVGVKRVSGKRNVTFTVPIEDLKKKYKSKIKSDDDLYKKTLLTPLQIQKKLKIDKDEMEKITKTVTYKPYLM